MTRTFLSLATTALLTAGAFAQGSLTPPSGPAPSMKTLGQIEPRVPIEKLPFKISASGSYYVGANLVIASGSGISIEADNVTVDLGGFNMRGDPTSLQAIVIATGRSDVSIKNGSITGSQLGIDGAGASRVHVQNVRVTGANGAGISLGAEASVEGCVASDNEGTGIKVGVA